MRILVYGAGNIGSLYAALLKESGQDVAILARGERRVTLRDRGIELEDAVTGESITSRVEVVERLAPDDVYDLVLVVLPKDQVAEVLPILSQNHRTPNVLFFGNNAAGAKELTEALGDERVLLGFPGAAVIPEGKILRYLILSERQQPTTLGELDGKKSARIAEIAGVLEAAGFLVSICPDMDAWLKTHVFEICPTASALYMAGGDVERLASTPDALVLMLRAIREGHEVLSALGIAIQPPNHGIVRWLPEPLLLWIARRMLVSEGADLKIGHALAARSEMWTLADEQRELIRKSGVPTPSIDRLNRHLDPETEPLAAGSAELSVRRGCLWILLAVLAALVALLSISGCGEAPAVPAPETARTTVSGEVVGLIADNGAHVWRGIPYAASTSGPNRWRAPRPPPSWQSIREALDFAERCVQLTNELDQDEGLEPGRVVGSEDCLTLDVYAPADARPRGLPVMVWIHGGGNVWGRSSAYDGSRLAANENVIVVAVQYRLGPLGWFAHPALRANATKSGNLTPEDAAASFTLLDLIAALEWVRDNIAAFGGAPGNVTIFGESAGGHNVAALLASPRASGLFHRAIIQSGSFDSLSLAEAQGDVGSAANPSRAISERLSAATAEQLRAVDLDRLFAAYDRQRGFLDVPRMIEDGIVLPARPLREAFRSTETFHAVPIMTGSNRDEMKLFYAGHPVLIRKAFGLLPVPRDQVYFDALTGYLSRLWRLRSVDEPAATMVAAGHEAVYAYRFDWDDGGRLLSMNFATLFGAAHGFEIPFVFNRFQHLGDADRFLFERDTADDRERLSRAIGSYWASFARDGVPFDTTEPAWPRYGARGGSFLRLDTANDGGVEEVAGAETLESVVADLEQDSRLDDAQKCAIVNEMGEWMFTRPLQARVKVVLGCGADER